MKIQTRSRHPRIAQNTGYFRMVHHDGGHVEVAMHEDHSRVRQDQAPENYAVLRHIALNLLKQEKTIKGGIHNQQFQAAGNEGYLFKVLAAGI